MEANFEKLIQLKIFFGQEGRFGGKFAKEKLGRPREEFKPLLSYEHKQPCCLNSMTGSFPE